MKTLFLGIVFFSAFFVPAAVYSGEIEIGGKWYTFEQILPQKNVEAQEGSSGLPAYRGISDELLDEPARILVVLGDRWGKCLDSYFVKSPDNQDAAWCFPNAHLASRFWAFRDPTLIIRERDVSFYYVMTHTLRPAIKKEHGWYEFELGLLWTRDSDEAVKVFRTIANIVKNENTDYDNILCVEMLGHITWWGDYNIKNPNESYYTYSFRVDSIRVAGTIPSGHWGVPVLSLDEATIRCSAK
jgi:hypothetical protein